MATYNALRPTSTFSATITFVGEMTEGGAEADARSSQYQRWHCLTLGAPDPSTNNTQRLDNVIDAFFNTQVTFFERASYRYPTPGSVALITGKFFITEGTTEPEIRVRAEPIRVYVQLLPSSPLLPLYVGITNHCHSLDLQMARLRDL